MKPRHAELPLVATRRTARSKKRPPGDPVKSAIRVGLRYVSDQMPGITRERAGKSFRYRFPIGEIVKAPEVLGRIKSLAIPPAWAKVWICPDPSGHLQATGRDARGRKQHRYHPHWREARDETKYTRMISFARKLPAIRQRVFRDLKVPDLPRNKVLAAVVRLLEVSLIRVGNDEYARENDSFGLTTMRDRHVRVRGGALRFHFRGKSGKWHEVDIRDRRLAKIVKQCQDLPGQELFQYIDEDGKRQDVHSNDVNDYLREISGEDFTAKDFRTWAGTVLGAMALQEFEQFDSQAQAKKNIVKAIEAVAARLGNTPSVCRKCYIHPDIVNSYLDGTLIDTLKESADRGWRQALHKLHPEEAAVLALLQRRLTAEKKQEDLGERLRRSIRAKQGRETNPKSQTSNPKKIPN
jgi:DNA topoisomerase I